MFSLVKTRHQRVHFSIKDRYIRFLATGKNRTFHFYGQKHLPHGVIVEGQIKDRESLQMILEEIIDHYKLKGSKITFCIPDAFVILRKVLVPLEITEAEIKGYLYMQLGDSIHLPFEDPVLEAVLLGRADEQNEVLLIASKESILRDFTEVFQEASLKPVVADLSILSLYRMYYHLNLADKNEHLLMVHIGLDSMAMSVFYEYKPVLVRHFQLPFSETYYELAESRSGQQYYQWCGPEEEIMGQAQDMTTEIERFMSFYRFNLTRGKHQITKLFITGDHPCMAMLEENISNSFEIEVQSLLKPLFQTKKGINIPPVYADCIGLALK
ncbi:hypothetical protein D0469_00235 [Peribacillus saganii]|uniref:Pilus assembly protein PilM n=1 Tax=Peribacillus saganii TaxID=2303992 RepID=A0A372LU39_9BACI|nr:pilus assembly protein PilM [Peribacillus saganii]RFU71576.1 hypothetical protein D0469_00235 [Peribacillus saganii]